MWQGFSEGLLQVVLFKVLCFKWSVKKHCVEKILQEIWKRFLYENNHNYNCYKISDKFTLSLFCLFIETKNKNQEIDGLLTRISFAFCL